MDMDRGFFIETNATSRKQHGRAMLGGEGDRTDEGTDVAAAVRDGPAMLPEILISGL